MGIEYLVGLADQAWAGGRPVEGSADSAELTYLTNIIKNKSTKRIGEIGFNAGLSSYTFLAADPDVQVCSFDLGEYEYVRPAKEYIDHTFPGRNTLILGDSAQVVPRFQCAHPDLKFDLIFIDGGHRYDVVRADLTNMKKLAAKEAILIIDDLTPWKPWGEGPTLAWREAIRQGLVVQDELVKDGEVVEAIEPPGDRSWALGHFA